MRELSMDLNNLIEKLKQAKKEGETLKSVLKKVIEEGVPGMIEKAEFVLNKKCSKGTINSFSDEFMSNYKIKICKLNNTFTLIIIKKQNQI